MVPVRVRQGGVPFAEFFGNPRDPLPDQAQPEIGLADEVADVVPIAVGGQEQEDPSDMSDCEDLEDPSPVRDEDGVLYADIAQEGGERFERLLRSLGPEWDIPGYESERDEEDEGEEGDRRQEDNAGQPHANEGEQEANEMQDEASEEQQEEVLVRAGHTAQARRRSEGHVLTAEQVAQIYADDRRTIREIINDPFHADLVSPDTRRNVVNEIIGLITASHSQGLDPSSGRDARRLVTNENRMRWQDFEDTIDSLIESLPQETDRQAIHDQIGPYMDFIEMARTATRPTAVRPPPAQRWGGQFFRQSLPGMEGGEDEVDSDGEPMVTWTRTGPPFTMPHLPVETGRETHQPHYSQEPRWNYSTTLQPTVSDIVQQIHAAQVKRDDNDDMFGLANSGYSSNRVRQYRLTDPVPGPSGTASTRMNGPVAPVRYRATLGRHARSREIVFGMNEAADRFEDALQGVLAEVQGVVANTSASTNGMEDRSREFAETTRRMRRADRMRPEEDRKTERKPGQRPEAVGAIDDARVFSTSKPPNKVDESEDGSTNVGGPIDHVYWLSGTAQYDAYLAMQRLLERPDLPTRVFVPLRRGQGDESEYQSELWEDLRVLVERKLLHAMRCISVDVRRIVFGTQYHDIEAMMERVGQSVSEHLSAYMSDDACYIAQGRDLVARRLGESWHHSDDYAFGDAWLAEKERECEQPPTKLSDGLQQPIPLEADLNFMEEKFVEYIDLMQGFYKTTLNESLVVQADHPYLDRIQRMTYGTRTGYWIRACFEGHARDTIKLSRQLKQEEEAEKAKPDDKDLEIELAIDDAMGNDGETSQRNDEDKDSMDLAREADELIASTADTNERVSRLWAVAYALLDNDVRR
jgi:hypothetical protein